MNTIELSDAKSQFLCDVKAGWVVCWLINGDGQSSIALAAGPSAEDAESSALDVADETGLQVEKGCLCFELVIADEE